MSAPHSHSVASILTPILCVFGALAIFALDLSAAPPDWGDRSPVLSERMRAYFKQHQSLLIGEATGDKRALPEKAVATFNFSRRFADAIQNEKDASPFYSAAGSETGVCPKELKTIVELDGAVVEKASSREDAGRIADAIERIQSMLDGESEISIEQVAFLERDDDVLTTAWFSASSETTTLSALWTITWMPDISGTPIIGSIKAEGFTKTTPEATGSKMFAESTVGVLKDSGAYEQICSYGGDQAMSAWVDETGHGLFGISLADVNGDGLDDVFCPQPNGAPNLLLIRQEDGTVKNEAKVWGLDWIDATKMGLFADLDNDGDQDLAILTDSNLILLQNDGQAYEEKSRHDIGGGGLSLSDYNGDGLVDVLVYDGAVKQKSTEVTRPEDLYYRWSRGIVRLFKNGSGFQWTDVTEAAGLANVTAQAAAFHDFDRDGTQELFLVAQKGNARVFKQENGRFSAGKNISASTGSSVAIGDLTGDGFDECIIGNAWPGFVDDAFSAKGGNNVQLASGSNTLLKGLPTYDVAEGGLFNTGWTNGVLVADLDNNGREDFIASTGFVSTKREFDFASNAFTPASPEDDVVDGREISNLFVNRLSQKDSVKKSAALGQLARMLFAGHSLAANQRNRVFLNTTNTKHIFADASLVSGLDSKDDARGIATCDWDGDGDLDVWMNTRSAPTVHFFANQLDPSKGNAVRIQLVGKQSNRDAIGATVILELDSGEKIHREVQSGVSYRSQSSKILHFGLGDNQSIKSAKVVWPKPGNPQTIQGLKPGTCVRITQGENEAKPFTNGSTIPDGAEKPQPIEFTRKPLLPIRPVFPVLNYLSSGEETTRRVEWNLGRPLLLVLWDPASDTSKQQLSRLAKLRGLDCLALAPLGLVTERALPAAVAKQLKFTNPRLDEKKEGFHRVGFFEDGMLDQMWVLLDHKFRRTSVLRFPTGFLIDKSGRLAAIFEDDIDLKTVIKEFPSLKLSGAELVQAAQPFEGKHVGEVPTYRPIELIRDLMLSALPEAAESVLVVDSSRLDASANFADIRSLLATTHLGVGRGENLDRAEELIRMSLKDDPNNAVALNNFGVLKHREKKMEEAEKLLKKACKVAPGYASAFQNCATFLMQESRSEEAIPYVKQLVKIAPSSVAGHNMLGLIYAQSKDYLNAELHFKKVIALDPSAAGAYATLAKVYAVQEQFDKAKDILRDGLAIKNIGNDQRDGLQTLLNNMP